MCDHLTTANHYPAAITPAAYEFQRNHDVKWWGMPVFIGIPH